MLRSMAGRKFHSFGVYIEQGIYWLTLVVSIGTLLLYLSFFEIPVGFVKQKI